MKTLETLQRDMDTATDLQSIVRTMKVLAAVSIRQYERALESLTEYQRTVTMGFQAVLRNHPQQPTAFGSQTESGLIIFGSDHGLCGRYNESIVQFALEHLKQNHHLTPRLLVIGARVDSLLTEAGIAIEQDFFVPGSVEGITSTVQQILQTIVNWQQSGIASIRLCYQTRQTKNNYQPRMETLLPVDLGQFNHSKWPSRSLPCYQENSSQLLGSLISQHLFISLYNACAESLACEHASRLTSMQIAEKNIKEQLETLTGEHRQQRQQQITEELLDVIAGYEVFSGEKEKLKS